MNKVGIITFHCADNYGAMLQAYGLKEYLRKKNIKADIVQYEPPFMTGRHWWIPYVPAGGIIGSLCYGLDGWIRNVKQGKSFFKRRYNMKQFRKKYLGEGKLYFRTQLKKLPYQYYIVGSDQIWNPEITCGLRNVYFGDFKNKNKKKVIAYAASLGSEKLPSKYDKKFSELLKNVDIVSVRERAAIPYIKQFYKGKISAVPDPVFLLSKDEWRKVEISPDREEYIFVYMTEYNDKLLQYAKEISEKEGLAIIKNRAGAGKENEKSITDYTAGPAEFLGYMYKAKYVITNSFHGVAFSIIYHKKFLVFQHNSAGERISNILTICGLENRVYQEGEDTKIESTFDWNAVEKSIEKNVKLAEDFLLENIG